MSTGRKPRVGLLVEGPEVAGGIQAAARRHMRLMGEEVEVVPVAFETSRREADWGGRVERIGDFGGEAWRVTAADLRSDNRLTPESSGEALRHDMRYRSFADRLTAVARGRRLEVLHAFGLFHQRGLLAAYAAARLGIPYMLSLRGVDLETRVFDEKSLSALSSCLPGAAAVTCVSEDAARLLRALFPSAGPVSVVPNSLDPAAFAPPAPPDLPLLRGSRLPVIGCFGKFRRVTGLDYLLEAFERLHARRPAVLLLAGSFQKREVEYYNARLESLSCSASVLRVGHVEHARVLDYMRLCDVIAVPSVSDACPNKVLEAMHAGVPLVASDCGGIPELVAHGREALLVPAREPAPLAAALERALADRALARRLAAAARRRAWTRFRPEDERARWTEVYRSALSAGARVP